MVAGVLENRKHSGDDLKNKKNNDNRLPLFFKKILYIGSLLLFSFTCFF